MTVLLIDGRAWTREALARGLEATSPDLRVLGFAGVCDIAGAEPQTGMAVILLNMHGIRLGDCVFAAVAAIRSSLPGLPVMVLSEDEDTGAILDAIEGGLNGYVPMSEELGLLAHALRFVAAGGTFVPTKSLLTHLQAATTRALPATPPAAVPTAAMIVNRLTPRELAVLERVGQGKSNKQIARELNAREATIKIHVGHIMRKLRVFNRTQLALIVEECLKG
jgi:DNA-binding NarL/FixJ family response regulator